MQESEQKLLQALVDLETAVQSMATTKPNLTAMFERIDTLGRELPKGTDPVLLHYLNKKSYQKARMFLQGRETENKMGSCRHLE